VYPTRLPRWRENPLEARTRGTHGGFSASRAAPGIQDLPREYGRRVSPRDAFSTARLRWACAWGLEMSFTYDDEQKAFSEIVPSLRRYQYPPTKENLNEVQKIYSDSQIRFLGCAVLFICVSAFGVLYLINENEAFRLAAKFTLGIAPFVWIGIAMLTYHFYRRKRMSRILAEKWNDFVK
jgi:hypothetical protein